MLEKVKNKKRLYHRVFINSMMAVLLIALSIVLVGSMKAKSVMASMDASSTIFYPNLTSSLDYDDAVSYGTYSDFVRGDNGIPVSFQFLYLTDLGSSSVSVLTLYCYVHTTSSTAYVTYFDFYSGTPNITNPWVFRVQYVATSGLLYFASISTNGPTTENVRYCLSTYGLKPFSTTITGTESVTSTTLSSSYSSYEFFTSCFNAVPDTEGAYLNGLAEGRQYGYQDGYNTGYDEGYSAGATSVDSDLYYDSGYSAGYTAGANSVDTSNYYQSGYTNGYNAGIQASTESFGITDLLGVIFTTPITVMQNLFSFTIFGASAWSAIVSLLLIALIVWIFKKFFT